MISYSNIPTSLLSSLLDPSVWGGESRDRESFHFKNYISKLHGVVSDQGEGAVSAFLGHRPVKYKKVSIPVFEQSNSRWVSE